MRPFERFLPLFLCLALCAAAPARAQDTDAEGCKDHPMFSRMPGFVIGSCESKEFDAHEFLDAHGQKTSIEGKVTTVQYSRKSGAPEVSRLQIQRNYLNAVTALGGRLVGKDDDGDEYLEVTTDGRETWVHVNAYITDSWSLTIVERQAMTQDVTADAKALGDGIATSGHVAVYGIHFDTGKAAVLPASEPALAEITKLLAANPALTLNVVGHTDDVGALDANLALSKARAEAVIQALVTKHGVAASRLAPYGVGPLCPVAPNTTEEARAKNRRVELVAR